MKKTLTHLPKRKIDELRRIVDCLRSKVEDRYDPDYKITKKQLESLAGHVKTLQKLTKRICTEQIESF